MGDTPILMKLLNYATQPKKGILSFYIFLWTISIFSQQQNVYFQSIKQGIPNQFVRCILKDSRGFVWFGTNNGLAKYDGVNFVVYENNPVDTNSLSYNSINAIFEDKNKNIWIGTSEGLNIYNRDKDNFTQIRTTKNVVISAICEDNYNNIWSGTFGNGVLKYNLANKSVEFFSHNDSEINAHNSNHITSIIIDKKDRLWIGNWNGLDLMDLKGRIIKHFEKNLMVPNSLSDNYIHAMFLENNEVLWIGTLYGGLNKLYINDNNFTFKKIPLTNNKNDSPSILSLFAYKGNNLWIGTENHGLISLNTKTEKFITYLKEEGNPLTLNSNSIRSLYVDDLNILWIGTIGRGVNFMDERFNRFEIFKKRVNVKNSLCGEEVHSFAEDKQGNVWIATNEGINKFDVKTRQFTQTLTQANGGLTCNNVNSIVFDANDNLWVGTLGGGIDCFNKHLVKTGNYKIKGIQKVGENKITILYVDRKNNIWAGSLGSGLYRFNKSNNSFNPVFDKKQGIEPNTFEYINAIFEDSNNKLWIGTAYRMFCLTDLGNCNYSYEIFTKGDPSKNIPTCYITAFYEDHNKNLWIGSLDQGLILYNNKNKSFISYQKQDGLASNSIYGILEDNKGNFWISTNKGLAKFKVASKQIRNYTTEDGLVSNEFNGYHCCLKTRNGEFFFGSNDGFNIFYPDQIRDNKITQPIVLTDFKIFNQSVKIGDGSPLSKSISETGEITLNHKQSSFTIEFVALNYIQGSKNQYKFKLEGLENDWNTISHSNHASYSYLKPGTYLFKVKGSNNDGIWNETSVELKITILPPFWLTKWAYLLYLLILVVSILAIIKYRVTRAKQIHLAELNQMKLQFFANISHELRTPLSLILSPIENILAFAKDNKEVTRQLEMIYKNSNRLFRLVNEIMDFSKAEENKLTISVQSGDIVKFTQELTSFFSDEALRRQITYKLESKPTSIEAWFDRNKYEKIILNLLSNAFKFTPDNGTILVKIEMLDDSTLLKEKKKELSKGTSNKLLKISVIDNGRGISPKDIDKIFERFYQGSSNDYTYPVGTGIGLSLTKTLVEQHKGKIFVTSEEGKETCFTVLMPLGNDHFDKSEIIEHPIDISSQILEKKISFTEVEYKGKMNLSKNAPTILLVEDNFELRKYIVSAFSADYRILEANDGVIGKTLATEHVPDLIISDIIMPNMSGIELCKQIKENILTSHIPFILLTAKVTLEDKINGIETGADAYITKPFNVKYLEAVTKNLIETRKKLFKRFSQDVYILPKEMSNNPLDQVFLEKIIQYVEENIVSTDFSVEDLASHLLMSPGHIWRKVKSLTGLPTNEFIRTIRLKNAVKLMEESKLNLSEIAYKVGFSSPAYFTKCFRDQYGKSPSAFLSNKKNNNE
jgi:signal transduction histidine kinase/ligand-binding sensor domain-containing protein/DNA-binding response OmpR family regulator